MGGSRLKRQMEKMTEAIVAILTEMEGLKGSGRLLLVWQMRPPVIHCKVEKDPSTNSRPPSKR